MDFGLRSLSGYIVATQNHLVVGYQAVGSLVRNPFVPIVLTPVRTATQLAQWIVVNVVPMVVRCGRTSAQQWALLDTMLPDLIKDLIVEEFFLLYGEPMIE